MRVGIVGSGIAGLTAAWALHERHEVTVFEAGSHVGGHTNTLDVETEEEHFAVDTGFIVFNERTYPNFVRLLQQLGVASKPADMSFSVSCERDDIEYGGRRVSQLLAQPTNLLRPGFHRMLRDVVRFNREARRLLATEGEKVTLGDYVCGAGYSREFVERYLMPLGASIWSAEPRRLLEFPAANLVRFFSNHGLLDPGRGPRWRVVAGGSRTYVDAMTRPFRTQIRLNCPVRAVVRERGRVHLATGDGATHVFDRVILACHSDQALALLADPSGAERAVLGAIRYQSNETVLHTDPSVMPRRRRAWASWNYRIPREPQHAVAVTYDMNRLQGLASSRRFFVTLNQVERIDSARVIRRLVYDHPVFDGTAFAAQRLHDRIDGVRGTHFCGAYWGHGFHEDGVTSALRVARKLGGTL